ncbi:MAG: uridine kinase [Hyphomonadaceae bacterium]|nr:uridine kinase [Hyphomonadaceae bacterium]OUX94594.1 MAG: uridine kinase [Hyphomonas sp. TMED17]CAI8406968.1 MAG: Uridine kinase [Hyphomonas sp. TMED17]
MNTTKPYLVAISGGSGSGKSTLAAALSKAYSKIGVSIFHEDRYFRPMSHYGENLSGSERDEAVAKINFDSPESKDADLIYAHLHQLLSGQPVQQPIYDYERHDRNPDQSHHLEPAGIIIVEGIHALSLPEIRPLFDLSVYLHTPDDLRLARRIRRDVIERGRSVDGILHQYLESVRPSHYKYTHPAMFDAELVIVDEGLPARGHIRSDTSTIKRLMAPIIEHLTKQGLRPD